MRLTEVRWNDVAQPPWRSYVLAAAATALAVTVRWPLDRIALGPLPPFITFYPVVMLAAVVGGTGPGIVATVLGALAAKIFFIAPHGSLSVTSAADAMSLGLFCAIGVALSAIGGRIRVMHRHAVEQTMRAESAAQKSGELQGQLRDQLAAQSKAEEALRASEERLRLVVEHSPNAMVTTNREGRIVLVNAQAESLFGYSREELIGQPVEILVPPRFRDRHPEYRRGFAADPRARPMGAGRDLFGLRKDGTEVPVEIGLNPIKTDEGLLVLASIVNITERKRMEQAQREIQEQLQAANQTLEQRVAERTAEAERRAAQLRVLASQLTQAEQKERQRVAYILHEHFQQLLVSAKFNMGTLRIQLRDPSAVHPMREIDRLLDEAIQESRSLTVELSPPILYQASMARVLQWLARWVQEKHGLTVEIQADEKIDPQDPQLRELLFRSVRELLLNVVKYARADRAAIQMARTDSGQIRISVSDEGVGFDPAQHRWDAADGGFGLFNMQERFELLGGKVDVRSAPGVGTRVTLTAPERLPQPVADRPAEASQPTPAPTADEVAAEIGHRIRVLLADDHAMVRDGLARLLQMQRDIQVVGQAADGLEAVELARRLHPDIVLMDVSMPRLSGMEATQQIKGEMPDIHVVGLSMHLDKDIADAMTTAGAVAYLTKTAPPEELIATIRGQAVG